MTIRARLVVLEEDKMTILAERRVQQPNEDHRVQRSTGKAVENCDSIRLENGDLVLVFKYPSAHFSTTLSERWSYVLSEMIERVGGHGVRVIGEIGSGDCQYYWIWHFRDDWTLSEIGKMREAFIKKLCLTPVSREEYQILSCRFPRILPRIKEGFDTVSTFFMTESLESTSENVTSRIIAHLESRSERAYFILDFTSASTGRLMRYGLSFVVTSQSLTSDLQVSEKIMDWSNEMGATIQRLSGKRGRRLLRDVSPLSSALRLKHQSYPDNVADLLPQ